MRICWLSVIGRFHDLVVKQPSVIALFLCGAGYAVVCIFRARKRTEGARNARGPEDPRGLDASRHRGLSSRVVPQVRQIPRRPARGVCRFVPHSPRWTYRFRQPPFRVGHLSTAFSQTSARAFLTMPDGRRQWADWPAALRARTMRLGPPEGSAASPTLPSSGHRSPPRVWRR